MGDEARLATQQIEGPNKYTVQETRGLAGVSGRDANRNIDIKRVELAVALADIASQDNADLEKAKEERVLCLFSLDHPYGPPPGANWPSILEAKKRLPILERRIAELQAELTEAYQTWNEYQLDDVTLYVGSTHSGVTHWLPGMKGASQLFKAENAGKFLPKDDFNSLSYAIDLVTWAFPPLPHREAGGEGCGNSGGKGRD